jgi:hypothetical protein
MAKLSHPNVVTVFDAGVTDDGRTFLAMEIVAGGTLDAWLASAWRPWREVVRVLCEAGEGLAAAHRAGMIHRDFKLDNVVLDEGLRPKVTDFGLVCAAEVELLPLLEAPFEAPCDAPAGESTWDAVAGEVPAPSVCAPLTYTGQLIGTPGYMAPEQCGAGIPVDARADIFAFCAASYRALYLQRPFGGETTEQILRATCEGKVRAPPTDTDVPSWIRDVLLRGLSVDPEERPQSMEVVLAALRADPTRKRRRWLVLGAAALSLGAALVSARGLELRRARACHAAADRLDGAWDARRRAVIGQAFAATGVPYAAGAWERARQTLDAYAAEWRQSAEQACMATRVSGGATEGDLELRTSCLDERLDHLRALADVLAGANARTVEDAVKAAQALPPIDACRALDRLSQAWRLPSDPRPRAEIRALQGEIAAAKALVDAGQSTPALERLRGIQSRVAATGFWPIRFYWRERLADAESAKTPQAAAEDYEEAAELADAFRLDRERAEVTIELARLNAQWLGRQTEGRRWLHVADGALERMGGDARLEMARDIQRTWQDLHDGRNTDVLRTVLERAARAGFADPALRARAHGDAAWALPRGREHEMIRYAALALADAREAYGAEHPTYALYMSNLATFQLVAGESPAALASASDALAILERGATNGDPPSVSRHRAYAEGVLGAVLVRNRNPHDGIEHLGRARALLEETSGLENDRALGVDTYLAEAHLMVGDLARAARALEEARFIDARVQYREGSGVLLTEQAKLELARGRAATGLPLAERALAVLAAEPMADTYEVSSAKLVTARALAAGGDLGARARDLAEQARAGFVALNDVASVDEAAALLARLR